MPLTDFANSPLDKLQDILKKFVIINIEDQVIWRVISMQIGVLSNAVGPQNLSTKTPVSDPEDLVER